MTKREIKKREGEAGKLDESTGDYLEGKNPKYIATSPTGAGGQSGRNLREIEKGQIKASVRRSLVQDHKD